MLSPREHTSCWSRLKAPAAVSLACLAATLLIAAQGFRGHPTTKHSNLPAQHGTEAGRLGEAVDLSTIGQGMDTTSGIIKPRYKQSQEEEQEARSKGAEARVSLSSSTSTSNTGVHKQKSFDYVEISTAVNDSQRLENDTSVHNATGITAYREELQGMEILLVNKTLSSGLPAGILLTFHGCAHQSLDWWHPSANCPNCTGLPEEVSITKTALSRDFVVVAFSSLDRELHQCWDVSYGSDLEASADLPKVLAVWQELVERQGWAGVPRYALGGSSGGALALHLALRLPLNGVVSVIMAVPSSLLESKPRTADQSKSWTFPPTVFVHMLRDEVTAQNVAANIATLKKQGVRVNQIVVGPRNLTATFFSDRIEGISSSTSTEMYNALMSEGCLNSTGYLIDNPRSSAMMRRWQKALRENVTGWRTATFKMDESPVFEELNVAWAGHELVSDYTDSILDWLTVNLDGPKLMTAVNPRLRS